MNRFSIPPTPSPVVNGRAFVSVPRYLFALALATGALALILLFLFAPLPARGATVTLDGLPDPAYGPALAADPPGDLARASGPADWEGTHWTDLISLYVTQDSQNLYVFVPLYAYTRTTSSGSFGLVIATGRYTATGGTPPGDPWNNAITFNYTATHANSGTVPIPLPYRIIPDIIIRGNIIGSGGGDNGWTELRRWNGSDYSTGAGSNWGGASPSRMIGDHVAFADGVGVEFAIPFSDLGISPEPGTPIHLQFYATQTSNTKGAYDTVPSDEQSTGWDTPTTQRYLATYVLALSQGVYILYPSEGAFFAHPALTVTGYATPTTGVTVTVSLNDTALFTPALDAQGYFTQPVELRRGPNTITVTAVGPLGQATDVRHVTFGAAHDNDVFWDGLLHDTRHPLYRTPGGPVAAGTPVTLRLRAYRDDLTAAYLRLWDDRTDTATVLPMTVAASDPAYDFWAVTITPTRPTVLWYRFIVQDGTDTDFYEDDHVVDGLYRGYNEGGPGRPYDDSPDLSFQLTVYDPAFRTPDWLKNGIVYQIFPDRFRDGDPSNNVVSGTHFFYGNPTGGITYTTWNVSVVDPRDPSGPYTNRWSEDFYGGDLQGVTQKLDYLQSLGVTAIYLNPIFRSPSNHKYDTTTYEEVDPHLGGNTALTDLLSAARERGIRVILDGVFNHTSSDSIYFDRYSRYPTTGAYESQSSPYYDWYTFSQWPDGYQSWWGYETLPVLRSSNPQVRTYIYSGTDAIAVRWIVSGTAGWRLDVGGDVDPGLTRDPSNSYWEGFRARVKAADPDAVIIGEEWGDATPWLLGSEWDAVMNYRLRSALLSFLRETRYEDNDNNPSSAGGVLDPIAPSQLDAWLHSLGEDYPPEALAAMMNLAGSHDTNRVRFVLSHGQKSGGGDLTSAETDPYHRMLALLQFTLPGAPTVYYGDEVGVESPGRFYNGKWEDDPYNRVPFPWGDTPGFYSQRSGIAEFYALLGRTRAAHPALRTGSLDTLLTDDPNRVYVYGRRWISGTLGDAAIVALNRHTAQTQTVTFSVDGYLGEGAVFTDALHGGAPYTVTAGTIVVPNLPPLEGALLVLASGDVIPPPAPTLTATEGAGQVVLSWTSVPGAVRYHLYRSLLPGGGYTRIAEMTGTVYTDTAVVNGTWYYYRVAAVDGAGLEGEFSEEVAALPHHSIGWANLQRPPAITHTIGLTPTDFIYGQVWIDGVTNGGGATPGLIARLGFGPTDTPPISWTWWVEAVYNTDVGNNDEFQARLTPEYTGTFYYLYRYSTTGGRDWVYADQSGIITPTGVVSPGVLLVLPSSDTTPPPAPQNLRVTRWGADHVALAWDPVVADDLYAYDLYRWGEGEAEATIVARILHPTVVYTDTAVVTGHFYTYTVRALDTSFNRSGFSGPAGARAEERWVTVTFIVEVPPFTPPDDVIYIAGDDARVFGASWNPAHRALERLDGTRWTVTLAAPEDVPRQYKYTRGTWNTVEKWGALVGFANRVVTPTWGTTGWMTVTDGVSNWRDPLVVAVSPPPEATAFPSDGPITATFNRALDPATVTTATVRVWALPGGAPVEGTVAWLSPTVSFTPAAPLAPYGRYRVELTGGLRDAEDGIPLQRPVVWEFGWRQVYLPVVMRGN
ncbi:MAG: alpha amylase N-terminal ig-like domain-containing protein [Anaerolineae bacterium]